MLLVLVSELLPDELREGKEGDGFAVFEGDGEVTPENVVTGVEVGMYETIAIVIPLASVSLSEEKASVAGVTMTIGEGITEPEAENILPDAIPIRRKSQHPSVSNLVKFTRI